MNKIKALAKKLYSKGMTLGVLNAIAFVAAVTTVNAACLLSHHQPEMPSALQEMRKY